MQYNRLLIKAHLITEQMDNKYLVNNVGDALSTALAAMALEQPQDPVEFLGNFLVKFVQKQSVAQKVRNKHKTIISSAAAV